MRRPLAFAFCLSVLFAPGSALGYAQKYYQSSYYSQSYYQSYYQAAYSSGSGGTPNRDYRIFTYTGSTQSFTVPNGVTSLNVVVVGGGGGGGGGGGAAGWGSGAGGGCGKGPALRTLWIHHTASFRHGRSRCTERRVLTLRGGTKERPRRDRRIEEIDERLVRTQGPARAGSCVLV